MTQKELVKQAKKNIRKRNRENRRTINDYFDVRAFFNFILIVIFVGASALSFSFHIRMVDETWEYPCEQTEIVWTGICALPFVIIFGLIILFLIGLAIYSVIKTIIERNADKKRELEEEISKLSKENTNESK